MTLGGGGAGAYFSPYCDSSAASWVWRQLRRHLFLPSRHLGAGPLSFTYVSAHVRRTMEQIVVPLADVLKPDFPQTQQCYELEKRSAKSHVRGNIYVSFVVDHERAAKEVAAARASLSCLDTQAISPSTTTSRPSSPNVGTASAAAEVVSMDNGRSSRIATTQSQTEDAIEAPDWVPARMAGECRQPGPVAIASPCLRLLHSNAATAIYGCNRNRNRNRSCPNPTTQPLPPPTAAATQPPQPQPQPLPLLLLLPLPLPLALSLALSLPLSP